MGTDFYVACHDCKIYRYLDEFYELNHIVKTRKEAQDISEKLDVFRATLLVSFCGEHQGHKITVYPEYNELDQEISSDQWNPKTMSFDNPNAVWKKDINFWRDDAQKP